MAWNAVTDVNDGQSYGGAAWQAGIDAITQIQGVLGPDVPAWTNYTPVLGGAGWALGSSGSSANGAYGVIGDVVHFWTRLVFGTVGASFAATVPTVTLPVSADASQVAFTPRIGVECGLFDTSAGLEYVAPAELTATVANLMAVSTAAAFGSLVYAINTQPFTWAVSDVIRVGGWYRKA